ncbi:hypothetical protein CHFL109739_19350 [Chryseobacterium flavum]
MYEKYYIIVIVFIYTIFFTQYTKTIKKQNTTLKINQLIIKKFL